VGASFILVAFVLVALGGFGSVTGAFCRSWWHREVVGGFLWDPAYKMVLVLSASSRLACPRGSWGRHEAGGAGSGSSSGTALLPSLPLVARPTWQNTASSC
jgi:hypothetical protein